MGYDRNKDFSPTGTIQDILKKAGVFMELCLNQQIKFKRDKNVVVLASLGQLKYTLELDKKIIAKMKFIEGVGLKNDIGQDMAWSIEVLNTLKL